MSVRAGTRTEEVAKLIMSPTEAASRPGAFEAAHRPVSAFDRPVVLFDPIVEILLDDFFRVVKKQMGKVLKMR